MRLDHPKKDNFSTGFWFYTDCIVSCAHLKDDIKIGELIKAWDGESYFEVVLLARNSIQDLSLFKPVNRKGQRCFNDVLCRPSIGALFVGWVFSDNEYKGGESISVEYEGYTRSPWSLKLKKGQIKPGNSGAPLIDDNRELVGMIVKTRNKATDLGARAVPAETIKDYVNTVMGVSTRNLAPQVVLEDDLDTIIKILDVAYAGAKPLSPVANSEFIKVAKRLVRSRELVDDLIRFSDHNPIRERAVRGWFRKQSTCLRNITHGSEPSIKIGVSCVLRLKKSAYREYVSGQIAEFDLGPDDLEDTQKKESPIWICFQSFALSEKMSRETKLSLRAGMISHVESLLSSNDKARMVCEIGTTAGLHFAGELDLTYIGLSKEARPLFEKEIDRKIVEGMKSGL
uniref:Trypsin-like peptidase domain-containing protein n=1 Tax=Candidatus Kentrum sp. FW TaxID=2126338 RepID=A0A450THT2_9GAMM|nr:MAG: hypothetical protein BECKFW1821B_GA0114236_112110 [Candidatus Kentron sp. FW]